MLKFKFDVLRALREQGVSSTIRKGEARKLPQGTFTKIKAGEVPTGSIDKICGILQCQPGDLIEWVPDED